MDVRFRKVRKVIGIGPEDFLVFLCVLLLGLLTTACGGQKDQLAVIEVAFCQPGKRLYEVRGS